MPIKDQPPDPTGNPFPPPPPPQPCVVSPTPEVSTDPFIAQKQAHIWRESDIRQRHVISELRIAERLVLEAHTHCYCNPTNTPTAEEHAQLEAWRSEAGSFLAGRPIAQVVTEG